MDVVTKVADFKDFEEGTRAAAIELGLALAEAMPASLRKSPDTTSKFVSTLVGMLMEVETDEATWAETVEETDKLNTDPVSTASSALTRLSESLGEKTILAVCQPIIMESVAHATWMNRFAGYTLFGLITQTCFDSYSENLEKALQTATQGVKDGDIRVRYAAFGALSSLMTYLAPAVQLQFHKQLVPEIASHMANEPLIKMKTQATAAMLALCSGLAADTEEDEKDKAQVNGQS